MKLPLQFQPCDGGCHRPRERADVGLDGRVGDVLDEVTSRAFHGGSADPRVVR